jgi:hypothetical protein
MDGSEVLVLLTVSSLVILSLRTVIPKCCECLGFKYYHIQVPCNPLIEDYTGMFYIINEGIIPSILWKMSLRGPKIDTGYLGHII